MKNYKVLTNSKFGNDAYVKITGDCNFEKVPDLIYKLWYDSKGISIHHLDECVNSTNEDWHRLYDLLKNEFEKLQH